MRKIRNIAAVFLAALLAAGSGTAVFAASEDAAGGTEWQISKSKTAENLDENMEAKVTLSLPAAEEQLVSDVVFVLDKSTSPALEDQALGMLQNLKEQIDGTGAKVKVGVVVFDRKANVQGFMDLSTEYDAIEAAVGVETSSGTNTHAGLLAGTRLLDEDTEVDAARKYLIFISDGITYMYGEEPTAVAWQFMADSLQTFVGPDNWSSRYGSNDAPKSWDVWLEKIGGEVEADGSLYDYPYGGTFPDTFIPPEENQNHANSVDKALYLTYTAYEDAASRYHCYAMTANTNKGEQYVWGPAFMDYLAGGEEVDFTGIQNDIFYLLDAGSQVIDVMGKTDAYDFDFVNSLDALEVTVGGTALGKEVLGENSYGFGKKEDGSSQFVVTYIPEGQEGVPEESIVWDINVPVSSFAPVQLTYKVKLVNPCTEAGTYGQYDPDGSLGYEGLYTNNSAVLYPVRTDGTEGAPEWFGMPTVSYTVEEPDEPPVEPTVTPEAPTPAPDTGTTSRPAVKAEPAATGDHTDGIWMVLLAGAALGAVLCLKKKMKRSGC